MDAMSFPSRGRADCWRCAVPRYPARSGSVPGAGVHRSAGGRGDAPGEMQGTSLPAAGPGRALLASLATDSHLPGRGGWGWGKGCSVSIESPTTSKGAASLMPEGLRSWGPGDVFRWLRRRLLGKPSGPRLVARFATRWELCLRPL